MTCRSDSGEEQKKQSADDDRPPFDQVFPSREGVVDITDSEIKYILRKSGLNG
jgi:hypothetical protein